jgi:hypothetical protein
MIEAASTSRHASQSLHATRSHDDTQDIIDISCHAIEIHDFFHRRNVGRETGLGFARMIACLNGNKNCGSEPEFHLIEELDTPFNHTSTL